MRNIVFVQVVGTRNYHNGVEFKIFTPLTFEPKLTESLNDLIQKQILDRWTNDIRETRRVEMSGEMQVLVGNLISQYKMLDKLQFPLDLIEKDGIAILVQTVS